MIAESQPPSLLRSYLQLVRLPNVFTAMADVLMGISVSRGLTEPSSRPSLIIPLVAASSLLYLAGMVLNDVYDYEIDRKERPKRPLPSGAISLRTAKWLGYTLLVAGICCAFLVQGTDSDLKVFQTESGLVALALAAAVLLYDGWLKRTPLGPLSMGACRFLNVMLGTSVGRFGERQPVEWVIAAGIGVYIVGVTWFARKEAGRSSRWHLAAATLVMAAGICALAWSPRLVDDDLRMLGDFQIAHNLGWRWFVLWGMFAVSIGYRCVVAIRRPAPVRVQAAVKVAILSLVFFDAALACGARGMDGAFIALLLIPAMLIGRWIYST